MTSVQAVASELTICSVSYHHKRHLEWNHRLTNRLNRTPPPRWLVVENTPQRAATRLGSESEIFVVLDGEAHDPDKDQPASYHHGRAINKALDQVSSRFLLVLDPDFYIVRRQWISEVLSFMSTERLAFFGVPWHPRWYVKYRYFPCIHCLFIDLEQVERDSLDFRPGPDRLKALGAQLDRTRSRLHTFGGPHTRTRIVRRVRLLFASLLYNLKRRKAIGLSQDTGFRVFSRYALSGQHRFAYATPVYRVDSDLTGRLSKTRERLFDTILPDHLSYLPKRKGYFSREGFREHGLVDVSSYGWEEFFWKNEPFGFHIRGQRHDEGTRHTEIDRLEHTLASIPSGRPAYDSNVEF